MVFSLILKDTEDVEEPETLIDGVRLSDHLLQNHAKEVEHRPDQIRGLEHL